MSGPAPKAKDDRTRRPAPAKASIDVEVLPAMPEGATPPQAPEDLTTELADDWDAFWRSPLARTVAETDLPALRRLWRLRTKHAELLALVDRAPSLLDTGSTGQQVVHPALKAAKELEPAITALEDRFALSVKGRQNAGIRMGQLADVAKRHPELTAPTEETPTRSADPRLADPRALASYARTPGGAVDGDAPRPR